LYPFYKEDREKGVITDEQVVELLENVFIRLQGDIVNICIGGQNKNGECEINPLSYCVLKAVGNCNVPGPNLSLRLTENTPDEFFDECLKTIGTGLGYPAIMNDDVNIAALKKYGYSDEDVCNYSMVGCIENFITGMQPPWSDGRFDTPRYFDYVFNNGMSETNNSIGLDTGDVESIGSMKEFMAAFEKQLSYGVAEYCAYFNQQNNSINQAYYPEPFLSCFCYDCIGRGLDINNGGSKYPSVHGACLMGIGTTADSLAAIEKVVFIDKKATLTDIKNALNNNFEGYEELHKALLAAPKYGNNDDFVDKYAVWFIDYLGGLFDNYKTRDGGGFYIAAAANISNIYAGRIIGATPDGRLRGEPLSDAASPTYGRDVKGPTSTINSISKPDYTKVACGSVVNQKYSPSMFSDEKRKKLMALIRTYFKKGGQEIQINSTSREILEKAMEEPENYRNLVVRVSGFSAFYVTLERDVQLDILNRTQQE
jgi:formate C-acetyltransferase